MNLQSEKVLLSKMMRRQRSVAQKMLSFQEI